MQTTSDPPDDAAHSVRVGPGRVEVVAATLGCFVLALLVLIGTGSYGPGLSPDSIGYVATARSLSTGHGLGYWLQPVFVVWPPLYPTLLAGFSRVLGVDVTTVAVGVNLAAAVATVLLTVVLLRRVVGSVGVRVLALLVVAVSPALVAATGMVWTEVLWVALVLACLACLGRSRDLRFLVAAAVLVAPAFLTRYAGIVLVVSGAVTVGLATEGLLRRRIGRMVIYTAISSIGPVVWLARNQAESGTLMGPRRASSSGLFANLGDASETIGSWVIRPVPAAVQFVIGLLVIVGIVTIVVARTVREQSGGDPSQSGQCRGQDRETCTSTLVALGSFAIAYATYLVAARTLVDFDRLDARLLLPLLVPSVVVGAWAVDGLLRRVDGAARRRLVGQVALVAAALWLASLALVAANDARVHRRDGYGYASRAYAGSAVLESLRNRPPTGCTLVSNDPEGLWFQTGSEATLSPSTGDPEGLEAFVKRAGSSPLCLVWVDQKQRDYLLTPDALRQSVGLTEERSSGGGTVYRVTGRP